MALVRHSDSTLHRVYQRMRPEDLRAELDALRVLGAERVEEAARGTAETTELKALDAIRAVADQEIRRRWTPTLNGVSPKTAISIRGFSLAVFRLFW
jgi:hypothetical protein